MPVLSGFGTLPFGVAPFGLYVPDAAPAGHTGPIGCRYIDSVTGDYRYNSATGQLAQMPATLQRIMLALRTVKGSSVAIPEMGFQAPDNITSTFEPEIRSAVRVALSQLIDIEKIISLDEVRVEVTGPARARTTVSITDLVTQELWQVWL